MPGVKGQPVAFVLECDTPSKVWNEITYPFPIAAKSIVPESTTSDSSTVVGS